MTAAAAARRPPVRRAADVIKVIDEAPGILQDALNCAEAHVRAAATNRLGLGITRQSVLRFTADNTADVPNGTTMEITAWLRSPAARAHAAGDEVLE